MRRTLTVWTTLRALIAAPLLLAALPAMAEDAPVVISIVTGLAPGDLLNIRAKPSPIGKTEARLPDGSSVKNLGCNDVDGHQWCKVEDVDNPKVSGWAPARYLIPTNPQAVADANAPAVTEANPTEARVVAATAPYQPPPDLAARLGDADQTTGPKTSAAAIGRTAMQDAYGLAMVNENPSTGEIPGLVTEEQPAQDSGEAAAADVASAPTAGAIPVPTGRPQPANAAPSVDAQTVARLQPSETSATGAGSGIPCARYVGQPMTRCEVSVARMGGNKADITVTWPDGGTRVISFQAGVPAGSNAPGEFRFAREGSLNMIRVGVSERFEITDALALGE